ncbi:MAG: AAA family ATPase [Mycobacterium leprae]
MKLVVLFGPPAVGKMTVGYELERLTGLRLFHNHMTIELVLHFFPFGTPAFQRLVDEFRMRILEEVAGSDLPGMVFTYCWDLDAPGDKAFIDGATAVFQAHGAEICYVELAASLDERLSRNETPLRLAEKPSKRNLDWSRRNLLTTDQRHRLNSNGDFFYPDQHLRIDNTNLTPEQVARQIIERFGLPLLG